MSTPDIQVYRAIVQFADSTSGTLQVTVPALMGDGVLVPVTNVGFTRNALGQALLPPVGTNGFVAVQSGYNHAYWVADPGVTQAFVTNQSQFYAASAGSAAMTYAASVANAASAGAVNTVLSPAVMETIVPAGTVRSTVNAAADTGWLLFNQTVVNAQTLYPYLWGKAPASWKSGSSLVIPTMVDKMIEGAGTTALGASGGANSKTITANNLPTHTHAIDHDHGSASTGNNSGDHSHNQQGSFNTGTVSADHSHAYSGTTLANNASHAHGRGTIYNNATATNGGVNIGTNLSPGVFYTNNGSGYTADGGSTDGENATHGHGFSGQTGGISANHYHSVTISGATTGISASHNHAFDMPAFTGASGNNTTTATALDVTNAHLALTFQIKAH